MTRRQGRTGRLVEPRSRSRSCNRRDSQNARPHAWRSCRRTRCGSRLNWPDASRHSGRRIQKREPAVSTGSTRCGARGGGAGAHRCLCGLRSCGTRPAHSPRAQRWAEEKGISGDSLLQLIVVRRTSPTTLCGRRAWCALQTPRAPAGRRALAAASAAGGSLVLREDFSAFHRPAVQGGHVRERAGSYQEKNNRTATDTLRGAHAARQGGRGQGACGLKPARRTSRASPGAPPRTKPRAQAFEHALPDLEKDFAIKCKFDALQQGRMARRKLDNDDGHVRAHFRFPWCPLRFPGPASSVACVLGLPPRAPARPNINADIFKYTLHNLNIIYRAYSRSSLFVLACPQTETMRPAGESAQGVVPARQAHAGTALARGDLHAGPVVAVQVFRGVRTFRAPRHAPACLLTRFAFFLSAIFKHTSTHAEL